MSYRLCPVQLPHWTTSMPCTLSLHQYILTDFLLIRLQYRSAKLLTQTANRSRKCLSPKHRKSNWLFEKLGFGLIKVLSIPDRLRMQLVDREELQRYAEEQRQLELDRSLARMTEDQPLWTIDMAFYALSGGGVFQSKYTTGKTLRAEAIRYLARHDAKSLIPLQKAVLQDPSKADGIAKIIPCLQALWFGLQCFSRVVEGLAISLLELNTLAHCVCTLFIYFFWWHKPYDVRVHVLIESSALDHALLIERARTASARQLWRNTLRQIVVTIEELRHDGTMIRITSGTAWADEDQDTHRTHYREGLQLVEVGKSLPGTGFILAHDVTNLVAVHVSRDLLNHWQELWKFRIESQFCDLPEAMVKLVRDDLQWCPPRIRNLDFDGIMDHISSSDVGPVVPAAMILAFALYGGLHLLAWFYRFRTRTEDVLWKASSILAASSGLIMVILHMMDRIDRRSQSRSQTTVSNSVLFCLAMVLLLGILNLTGRSYLVVESFYSVPNSPLSVYQMPTWTAYFPHI